MEYMLDNEISQEEKNANKYVVKCCTITLLMLIVVWLMK